MSDEKDSIKNMDSAARRARMEYLFEQRRVKERESRFVKLLSEIPGIEFEGFIEDEEAGLPLDKALKMTYPHDLRASWFDPDFPVEVGVEWARRTIPFVRGREHVHLAYNGVHRWASLQVTPDGSWLPQLWARCSNTIVVHPSEHPHLLAFFSDLDHCYYVVLDARTGSPIRYTRIGLPVYRLIERSRAFRWRRSFYLLDHWPLEPSRLRPNHKFTR